MKNLRSIDLNLLTVLDALLEEGHVSRAAIRLNMSQPAVSSALQRCRYLFDDPLLERVGSVMIRTRKAEALRGPLAAIIGDVSRLIDLPKPRLDDIEQIVTILSADDPVTLLAGSLLRQLQHTAPGIRIVFRPWPGADVSRKALMEGTADLAISVFTPGGELETRTLLEERYVVAMRQDHPLAGTFDLGGWLAYPHVIVSGAGATSTPLDIALEEIGQKRMVGAVVGSFHMVPSILFATDCVAMMPSHGVMRDYPGLVTFEPPIPVSGFPLHLAWHSRNTGDVAINHVANTLSTIFAGLQESHGSGSS
ncbi:LysR substrate-binding domain-containing protein [Salinicola sp. CR57]|uniref:LysR family transcriptional regulator n=1 Tax=Salinicola sp. CR57 TaxID=1949086 RepID=UPI000DA1E91C|nr:LysR substrate-binding domain-containing protein [Salinicola sp. CR57]